MSRRPTLPDASRELFPSNPFAFTQFRTLLRNGAHLTRFPSITSALFPMQRRGVPLFCSLPSAFCLALFALCHLLRFQVVPNCPIAIRNAGGIVGGAPSQASSSKTRLSPFLATDPKNQPVSPIIATDPKTPSDKSFVCHTSVPLPPFTISSPSSFSRFSTLSASSPVTGVTNTQSLPEAPC